MENENTHPKVSQHHALLGILAYLGPLVIVPLIASPKDPFIKFHSKQGLILLALGLVLGVLMPMFGIWSFWFLWGVVKLLVLVLAIIGIMNVLGGREKELPLIGHLAKYLNF